MSSYEGWSNRETFMVASLIDNDQAFLKYILGAVERYMINNMESHIPNKLAMMVTANIVVPLEKREREAEDLLLVRVRLKAELRALVLQAFYDEVDWDELAEHYKTKYVENLVNDKELFPDIKDPIMDIMQSIDDKPSA